MEFLAQHTPEKIALSDHESGLTYRALAEKIKAMAKKWVPIDNCILALTATQHPSFIIQLLAAFYHEQPVAIFAANCTDEEKEAKCALLGNVAFINEHGELIAQSEHTPSKHHPKTALILFTSGSTGQEKAVQLSKKNILANCQAVIKALRFETAKDQLLFLPLSYSFGLLGQLLPGLMAGLTTKLITNFTDIKSILESDQIPQMWSGVPSHWFAISKMAVNHEQAARSITHVISAGAPLHKDLRANLMWTFPKAVIFNNYGLTEASPRVLVIPSDDPHFISEAVGYPIGDWKIKLKKNDELLIRGHQTMLGYLGDEGDSKTRHGWLSTGDLADISPTKLVYIKGRRDHVVNVAGEKVNVDAVERSIKELQDVSDAAVLPITDPLYGIRLHAFVTLDGEQHAITLAQLSERIRQQLLPRKLPLIIQLVHALPRNRHGKLDKRALTHLAENLIKKDTDHAD